MSIATTLAAGAALVIVLITRGNDDAARHVGSSAPPQAGSSTPQAPRPVQPAGPRPIVARLNPHPHPTVQGSPASNASPPVAAPAGTPRSLSTAAPLSADATAASKLLATELGAPNSVGEPPVRAASCASGACVIAYRIVARGTGVVFGEQAPLWRLLFTDPRVDRVTLLVYHANVGGPDAGRLLFRETCSRSSARELAGSSFSYAAVSRLCRVMIAGG